jgi:hypothetical protein
MIDRYNAFFVLIYTTCHTRVKVRVAVVIHMITIDSTFVLLVATPKKISRCRIHTPTNTIKSAFVSLVTNTKHVNVKPIQTKYTATLATKPLYVEAVLINVLFATIFYVKCVQKCVRYAKYQCATIVEVVVKTAEQRCAVQRNVSKKTIKLGVEYAMKHCVEIAPYHAYMNADKIHALIVFISIVVNVGFVETEYVVGFTTFVFYVVK